MKAVLKKLKDQYLKIIYLIHVSATDMDPTKPEPKISWTRSSGTVNQNNSPDMNVAVPTCAILAFLWKQVPLIEARIMF